MRIAFHCDSFSLRGATVATLAYARMCQNQLGYESVIVRSHGRTPWIAERPVPRRYDDIPVFHYEETSEINKIISKNKIDALYVLTSGQRQERFERLDVPLWIHAAFPTKTIDIHGDRYACVSDWLAKESFNQKAPYVPHIVEVPEYKDKRWREHYGIPDNAILIGSAGGTHSFDLSIARKGLKKALELNSQLYFVSLNHAPFVRHKQAIFINGTDDLLAKSAFINACDVMLHGRAQGETFGLACAEFAAAGKPVFAWRHAPERHHLAHFCPPPLQYSTAGELSNKLLNFDRGCWNYKNLQASCLAFQSHVVSTQFKQVFVGDTNIFLPRQLTAIDKALILKRRLQRSLRARISSGLRSAPNETFISIDPVSGFPMEE